MFLVSFLYKNKKTGIFEIAISKILKKMRINEKSKKDTVIDSYKSKMIMFKEPNKKINFIILINFIIVIIFCLYIILNESENFSNNLYTLIILFTPLVFLFIRYNELTKK